jgi:hypothetical protein
MEIGLGRRWNKKCLKGPEGPDETRMVLGLVNLHQVPTDANRKIHITP